MTERELLLQIFTNHFNKDDLRTLCFQYKIEEENLELDTKARFIVSLIRYLERRVLLTKVINDLRQSNPEFFPATAATLPANIPIVSTTSPPQTVNPTVNSASIPAPQVFISYAWGGESEKLVNQLDEALQKRGLTIIRDKRDLKFKGRIQEFMRNIGRGSYIIVVISDKYLKSSNCMFELLEIAECGNFVDRIFPIVLADADFYKAVNRLKYIQYWEKEIKELDDAIRQGGIGNLQGITDELNLYIKIREKIAGLTEILRDMNTLTPEMHSHDSFAILFEAISKKIQQDQAMP